MKAYFKINMPTVCIECPFHRIYADGFMNETHCSLMGKRNKDGVNTKAEWCPLKPMPSKRISAVEWLNGIKTHEPTEYDKGWNDCVDMLEGENYE